MVHRLNVARWPGLTMLQNSRPGGHTLDSRPRAGGSSLDSQRPRERPDIRPDQARVRARRAGGGPGTPMPHTATPSDKRPAQGSPRHRSPGRDRRTRSRVRSHPGHMRATVKAARQEDRTATTRHPDLGAVGSSAAGYRPAGPAAAVDQAAGSAPAEDGIVIRPRRRGSRAGYGSRAGRRSQARVAADSWAGQPGAAVAAGRAPRVIPKVAYTRRSVAPQVGPAAPRGGPAARQMAAP